MSDKQVTIIMSSPHACVRVYVPADDWLNEAEQLFNLSGQTASHICAFVRGSWFKSEDWEYTDVR